MIWVPVNSGAHVGGIVEAGVEANDATRKRLVPLKHAGLELRAGSAVP